MPFFSPQEIYWTGVIVSCLFYLFIVCVVADSIWDTEFVGILYELVWNLVLRTLTRWFVGLCIICWAGSVLVVAAFTFSTPWQSLEWVLVSIPSLRILIWLFWLLMEGADTVKWGRDMRAQQQGIYGWDRFLLWCVHWGEYEGLLTKEEKEHYRNRRRTERAEQTFAHLKIPVSSKPENK